MLGLTRLRAPTLLLGLGLALAACGPREVLLPGERFDIRPDAAVAPGDVARAIALPPAVVNAEWGHRNGSARGRAPHLAFSTAPVRVWSTSLGAGSSRRDRILAAPVVAGGRVFAMDAAGQLSALDSASGAPVWRRSLVPPGQDPQSGPGGGMAVADGRLFVTTGFGEVHALRLSDGAQIWRVTLDAPVRAAPTVADGRLFVVARNDVAYALSTADGSTLWRVQGTGGPGVLGGASVAADGELAVLPFMSGEVIGVLARNGLQVWGTAVTGGRRELVRNRISDITGDPVIDGSTVYASNQSGRTVSVDRATGERAWTMAEGAFGPAWPVAGSVFLLSDRGALVRAEAATGDVIWSTQLPEYTDEDRREAIAHHGPLLAGGRLWVASADGLLRSFSPTDGRLLGSVALPGGAAAPPALARGVLHVVTRDGMLHAFQ